MNFTKQTIITAFGLFSLFFGAGNLILPPFLGYNAGQAWIWVSIGFILSGVFIPIMAIYGHAKLQGTMMDFALKVSPRFALGYCICMYAIAATLPGPRTASVTYEMAIAPYFEISSLTLSSIYFLLVLVFVWKRAKVLDLIGKFLTPLILCILAIVVVTGLIGSGSIVGPSSFESPLTSGFLEGYQTFDAIGGVVVGAVVVVSLSFKNESVQSRRQIIVNAGILAGLALLLVYGGLIALGASTATTTGVEGRTQLLNYLSYTALGPVGAQVLAVLVSLACFTTAVGVVTGTADFVKRLCNENKRAYDITAVAACFLGVLMGQLDVGAIIKVAVPVLMFIYPITIILIILNALPNRLTSVLVFRATVFTTILFSIPDFLGSIGWSNVVLPIQKFIPLGTLSLGWALPSLLVFMLFQRKFYS